MTAIEQTAPPRSRSEDIPLNPNEISPNREFRIEVLRPLKRTPSKETYSSPEWHAPAHRFLRDLADLNRLRPVNLVELEKVEDIADARIASQDPKEMLMFMKLLSQFYFTGAKPIFFKVLRSFREMRPDLNVYFRDVDIDDPDEGPTFTRTAIHKIFDLFESEFGYPRGCFGTCSVSELPGQIKKMIDASQEDLIRAFVVDNDIIPEDPHVVPVFIHKKNGKVHVFIFDSLGHKMAVKPDEKHAISASLEELIKHFSSLENVDRKLAIYSYKYKRQHNVTLGCVVFSVLDLKNLVERHMRTVSTLLEFYETQGIENQPCSIAHFLAKESELPIFEILTIPPEMMKVTQSLQGVGDYELRSPVITERLTPSFQRYSPSGEINEESQTVDLFREKVSEIERIGPRGRTQNCYVEQKRLKYTAYLLGLHFRDERKASNSLEGRISPPLSPRIPFPALENK